MLKKLCILIVLSVLITGCASKPHSSKFFTAKRYKVTNHFERLPDYPYGFVGINQKHFKDADKVFFFFYYNNDSSDIFHIKFYGPNGKFCQEDHQREIEQGNYYWFSIPIVAYGKKFGKGKHRADLYRRDKKIDSIDFSLEK